jgi:hypothetical protein
VDYAAFGQALAELSFDDVRSIASDLHAACSTAADELAATRATLVIEHTLRRAHRVHDAATSSLLAATAVQTVAERAHVELPDDDVTFVARAAAQLARGLVVGDHPGVDDALAVLGRGWRRVACLADLGSA